MRSATVTARSVLSQALIAIRSLRGQHDCDRNRAPAWLPGEFDRPELSSGSAALGGDTQVVEYELGSRTRMAEQIALHMVDTGRAQECKLFFGLNPLSGRDHIETATERRDSVDDCGALRAHRQFMHERFVDLDLVEWKHAQIAERG